MLETDGMYRSNFGGIIVAVMMQQLNKTRPDDYLLAMRVLWAPIGLMLLVCSPDRCRAISKDDISSGYGFPSPLGFMLERGTKKGP